MLTTRSRRSFFGSCRRSAMSAAISATTASSSSMALGLSGFDPPDFDLAVLFPRPNLGLLDLEGRPLDRSPRRSLMDRLVPLAWSLQDFLGAWMSTGSSIWLTSSNRSSGSSGSGRVSRALRVKS
uniref:Putative secreted protein n=1 Tax=Ixodes ricinus TaxID=34613 RepID=A0A6B0UPQ8_IXORI